MKKPTKVAQIRSIVGVSFVCVMLTLATVINNVGADQFDEQIRALQNQNENNQAVSNQLGAQASSYADAINKLQAQIDALQAAIAANQQKSDEVKQQIIAAQAELDHQKKVLGENIKAMYLEGKTTTIEMLASSKNLSEFVDKEQSRNAVQGKVKDIMAKITTLQQELKSQEAELAQLIKDQEAQNAQLGATRSEQSQLLAYTEGQKSAYDQQIKSNNAQIASLRAQQAAANARFIGGTPGTGPACGGGYPGHASGPWGAWGCNYPLDHNIDNWGMYNRQCVSYTAYKIASSGRHMPYWGGHGNANQWDDSAVADGIPVDSNPRAGDVAISNSGFYGHAMYVEHVYGDGRILISQYNAGWDGRYSEKIISAAGLVFIHF